MKNGAFPTLPLIRHKADAVTLGGEFLELMVQRADRTALAERSSELMLPDSILLSATGVHVSVTVDFTPTTVLTAWGSVSRKS